MSVWPRRRAAFLLVTVGTLVFPRSEAGGRPAQVARSEDGVVAGGYLAEVPFPDGTTRRLEVMLVVPTGAITSTEPVAGLDLGRPWVLFSQTIVSDPSTGHRRAGTVVCDTVANPERWATGSAQRRGSSRVWAGSFVEAACGDDSGYETYHVRWDPAAHWPLVTNRATAAWMGGQLSRWSSAEAEGTLQLWPTANQQAVVTICGTRHGGDGPQGPPTRSACFDAGVGQVIPSTAGLVSQANSHS